MRRDESKRTKKELQWGDIPVPEQEVRSRVRKNSPNIWRSCPFSRVIVDTHSLALSHSHIYLYTIHYTLYMHMDILYTSMDRLLVSLKD